MVVIKQRQVVKNIFESHNILDPFLLDSNASGKSFAPSNIALVKYWGKANTDLNIPYTDSISISLGDYGATTKVSLAEGEKDIIILNNTKVEVNNDFYTRLVQYLDIFSFTDRRRPSFKIETNVNIPVAAGLASSACGFAALVLALNDMYNWNLDKKYLSILARFGSGSAARSLWHGFVYWQKGINSEGMDSYAYKIADRWQDLCIGLLILSDQKKSISSREAMLKTVETSILYQRGWAEQVKNDIKLIKLAIQNQDLELLGQTAENNALSMHATMLAAKPAICYSTSQTLGTMHAVWSLRKKGLLVYFTQDAGSNLKLIFSRKDLDLISKQYPDIKIISSQ